MHKGVGGFGLARKWCSGQLVRPLPVREVIGSHCMCNATRLVLFGADRQRVASEGHYQPCLLTESGMAVGVELQDE